MSSLTNEKVSGGNPRLNPNTPLYEDCSLFVEPLKGDTDTAEMSRTLEEAEEITETVRIWTTSGDAWDVPLTDGRLFTAVTYELQDQLAEAGLLHLLGLWCVLARSLKAGKTKASYQAEALSYAEIGRRLKPNKPLTENAVAEQVSKLAEAGFIQLVPARKQVKQGTTRKAGYYYLPIGLRPNGKVAQAPRVIETYSAPGVNVENSTPRAITTTSINPQKTEALTQKTGVSLSITKESENLINRSRSKRNEPISEKQLTALTKFLKRPDAVLRLYGINDLAALTMDQAKDLIQFTLGNNEELAQRIYSTAREIDNETWSQGVQEALQYQEKRLKEREAAVPMPPSFKKKLEEIRQGTNDLVKGWTV